MPSFRICYEDGDSEDLKASEVKPLLCAKAKQLWQFFIIKIGFKGANLFEANLTGANIANAIFEEANLSSAIWIDGKKCALGSVGKCD